MEAPWTAEAGVPSRGLLTKRSRPNWLANVLPGAIKGKGGDGALAGADASHLAEEHAAGRIVRWPTRCGSTRRESERFGGAGRRKSSRVVNGTGYGCSSSDKRIGGLQTLVTRVFGCEPASISVFGPRQPSWAELFSALTSRRVSARRRRHGCVFEPSAR